jgi:hypothetical protein
MQRYDERAAGHSQKIFHFAASFYLWINETKRKTIVQSRNRAQINLKILTTVTYTQ